MMLPKRIVTGNNLKDSVHRETMQYFAWENYLLVFRMSDVVRIPTRFSPFETSTPELVYNNPRTRSSGVSLLTTCSGESMISRTLRVRTDSRDSPRAARSRIVFSEILPTHRPPSKTASCE